MKNKKLVGGIKYTESYKFYCIIQQSKVIGKNACWCNLCAGIYLGDGVVMTVASKLPTDRFLRVIIGREDDLCSGGNIYNVIHMPKGTPHSFYYKHPSFDRNKFCKPIHDIAFLLLSLKKMGDEGEITLPENTTTPGPYEKINIFPNNPEPGTLVKAIGFGDDKELKEVDLPVWSHVETNTLECCVDTSHIAIGGEEDKGLCYCNIGGPAFIKDDDDKFTLIGMFSFVYDLISSCDCGKECIPGGFARVIHLNDPNQITGKTTIERIIDIGKTIPSINLNGIGRLINENMPELEWAKDYTVAQIQSFENNKTNGLSC